MVYIYYIPFSGNEKGGEQCKQSSDWVPTRSFEWKGKPYPYTKAVYH